MQSPHSADVCSQHIQILRCSHFHMMEPAYCLQGKPVCNGKRILWNPHAADLYGHTAFPEAFFCFCPKTQVVFSRLQILVRHKTEIRCGLPVLYGNLPAVCPAKTVINTKRCQTGHIIRFFSRRCFQHHSASLRNSVSGIIFHRNVFHFIPFSTKTLSLQEKVHLFSTGLKYQLDPWSAISSYGDLQFLRKSAAQTVRIQKFFSCGYHTC